MQGMQESQTEKEEMKQQQRMKVMTDVTKRIKRQNRREQQFVGQWAAGPGWEDTAALKIRKMRERGWRPRLVSRTIKSADGGTVKGMNPTPHIHEHLRYTIMATALRTPSRITTSRLSTLR